MILMPQIFDVTANENVRYKRNELECTLNTWIERHTFNVCFFLPCVIHAFEKHAFNAWVEKPAFYHPLKSLMLKSRSHRQNVAGAFLER